MPFKFIINLIKKILRKPYLLLTINIRKLKSILALNYKKGRKMKKEQKNLLKKKDISR